MLSALPALPATAAGEDPAWRDVTAVFLSVFFSVPSSKGGWIIQPNPKRTNCSGTPAEPQGIQGSYRLAQSWERFAFFSFTFLAEQ